MAANRVKLIDWNESAKVLLTSIEEKIEEAEAKDSIFKHGVVIWLKELRQALRTCNDIEFLGFMMSRYSEPLMYAAVEALEGVLSCAD